MDIEKLIEQAQALAVEYIPRLVGAILIGIVGLWLIGTLTNRFSRLMDKKEVDVTLKPFMRMLFNVLLKILLLISVLGTLGVTMASFIAVLAAAGLAIGMALSGTLQNFAGGVVILIFKPFKVGDFIESASHKGTVSEIQIFNTILKTPDNKTIIIPNGGLSNSSMVNYSTEPKRRVDWVFGIAYGDDVEKAKEVIGRLLAEDDRIIVEPPVFMALNELANSSVNIVVRAWVNAPDYFDVYFRLNDLVYKSFPEEGLNIPFPQMDVHLHQLS